MSTLTESQVNARSEVGISFLTDFPIVKLENCVREALPGDLAHEGLRRADTYGATLANLILEKLTFAEQDALNEWAKDKRSMTFQTFCSGSECPAMALWDIEDGLSQKFGCEFTYLHELPMEKDDDKRQFLVNVLNKLGRQPTVVGKDVNDVASGRMRNFICEYDNLDGDEVGTPKEIEVTVAGYPCKDVSSRHKCRRDGASNIPSNVAKQEVHSRALWGTLRNLEVLSSQGSLRTSLASVRRHRLCSLWKKKMLTQAVELLDLETEGLRRKPKYQTVSHIMSPTLQYRFRKCTLQASSTWPSK